jgi:DNA-binding MarR family transcriptional regulator
LSSSQENRKQGKGGKALMKKKGWTFLTNHGRVLAYIAKHPQNTTQDTAQRAGLSIRAVQQIITDLEEGGYIARHKEGRCNRYTIHPEIPMRHRLEREHAIGDILIALGYKSKKEKEYPSRTQAKSTQPVEMVGSVIEENIMS